MLTRTCEVTTETLNVKPALERTLTAHAAAIRGVPLYVVEYAPPTLDADDGSRGPVIRVPILLRGEALMLAFRHAAPMHEYTADEVRETVRSWGTTLDFSTHPVNVTI